MHRIGRGGRGQILVIGIVAGQIERVLGIAFGLIGGDILLGPAQPGERIDDSVDIILVIIAHLVAGLHAGEIEGRGDVVVFLGLGFRLFFDRFGRSQGEACGGNRHGDHGCQRRRGGYGFLGQFGQPVILGQFEHRTLGRARHAKRHRL